MEGTLSPQSDEINFKSFVRFSQRLFRLVFLDFESKKELGDLKDKCIFFVRFIGIRICLLSYGLAIASHLTYFVVQEDKFNNSISVSHAMTIFIIGFKVFKNFWHNEELVEIFDELSALSSSRVDESRNQKEKPYLIRFQRIIKLYAVSFLTVSVPSVLEIFPYLYNGTILMTVKYWYPFDPHRLEYYPLSWLWTNWVAWIDLIGLLASDSLLYGLITYVVMEFDILKASMENLGSVNHHERKTQMKNLIKRHKKLVKICERLQEIYSLTFFFIFVISSSILCFAVFQISTTSDITKFFFYISYIGMLGGQVLLLCFFGQKLINSSEAIANGIYSCSWETSRDNSYKKNVISIMLRAQKNTRLTALMFADISLESFTSVSVIYISK